MHRNKTGPLRENMQTCYERARQQLGLDKPEVDPERAYLHANALEHAYLIIRAVEEGWNVREARKNGLPLPEIMHLKKYHDEQLCEVLLMRNQIGRNLGTIVAYARVNSPVQPIDTYIPHPDPSELDKTAATVIEYLEMLPHIERTDDGDIVSKGFSHLEFVLRAREEGLKINEVRILEGLFEKDVRYLEKRIAETALPDMKNALGACIRELRAGHIIVTADTPLTPEEAYAQLGQSR